MHTLKPLDEKAIIKAAEDTGKIVTVEEHSIYGGLGSAVSQVVAENHPVPVKVFGIPDEPAVTGYPEDIFNEYGLTPANISEKAKEMFN
jgi:transketolase